MRGADAERPLNPRWAGRARDPIQCSNAAAAAAALVHGPDAKHVDAARGGPRLRHFLRRLHVRVAHMSVTTCPVRFSSSFPPDLKKFEYGARHAWLRPPLPRTEQSRTAIRTSLAHRRRSNSIIGSVYRPAAPDLFPVYSLFFTSASPSLFDCTARPPLGISSLRAASVHSLYAVTIHLVSFRLDSELSIFVWFCHIPVCSTSVSSHRFQFRYFNTVQNCRSRLDLVLSSFLARVSSSLPFVL